MARWRRYFRSPENHGGIQASPSYLDWKTDDIDIMVVESTPATQDSTGAAKIQAAEAVGGRKGRYLLYVGLAMMMVIYELDNATVGTYRNFATSDFDALSKLATLNTAASIISAVTKPPIAKISDVLGRGEAYVFAVSCYLLSYILCASSQSFDTYAGGYVLYSIGQAGTSFLNATIVSDLSSMRWRGFAYNILYVPFLITPWVSAFIVDSVVNGIGWRWGIGMFAILMPFGAIFIITTLLIFQWRAKKAGLVLTEQLSIYEFCSRIDLGGLMLLSGGFSLILIPITLAATVADRWKAPWVDALIAVGTIILACLYPYEKHVARHPVVPVHYIWNLSVLIPVILVAVDNISFGATHTYLYVWSMVSHNFNARDAQFLYYVNGVMQALVGMATGLVMYRLRSYKWIGVAGAVIRMVGYGVMVRLRTNKSSVAELVIVQLVQGIGSGIIETVAVVAAQIAVSHAEMAQVTSLVMLAAYLGNGIGSSIAGGIYSGELRHQLRLHLGPDVNQAEVEKLYNSITGTLPAWGSLERMAINRAYSDVMGLITIAALAFSAPVVILSLVLPNKKLGDGHNLMQGKGSSTSSDSSTLNEEKTRHA
ncbi:siderochrome-iron transporter [Aspergillus uvarum CBS 121591]|uniref:Siderochrome-iron transporter n=1 Tax=Aspergillus uvarum CBS 121591 TaxID=1448315 RepID=A0A319DDV1_9EURO|nr:siderochrome-iron transporter [Aspergillus uvarum CBS 121591]PYH86258.1 siderochrome-iron transporter [Aspergillus uvarum CBS 121591]